MWKEAYKRQAAGDYDMFNKLQKSGDPLCHQLNYFHMATEKLGKSFFAISGPPAHSHYFFVRLLNCLKSHPTIGRRLGFTRKVDFNNKIKGLLPQAYLIERLAPVGGSDGQPNPEYPWTDANLGVVPPLDYHFRELNWSSPRMRSLVKLVSDLMKLDI